ncbi:hypothetical protein G4V39_02150 [Thermosulfuriphilus ammonigenes]|uniref:Uncharacterized protein n=1 Tax=Thermosulfuriphilus ammonigenes TaxID=1936021 RepID=A0A6G7PU86_9BACT|nr:hypothetical protein [Thermosulfuriphilus ammonigenes]MBA2848718.1 hypothetical protein [Thermosulfuriphilus ammonigenes]QIJ71147.1 hypothetical protein G4V39_02150 [Thermosulfuriphilus ammonigenes]
MGSIGSPKGKDLKTMAEDVFSSEKREDIWAIIISLIVLLLSMAFPQEIYHFFKKTLFIF